MEITLADLSPEDRKALKYNDPLLDAYASSIEEKYGLTKGMLLALKNAGEKSESTGPRSVSPKGARGVMQFTGPAAKDYGLADPHDPLEAIDKAGLYVRDLGKKLGTTDPSLIAAAYNAGPNRKALREGKIPNIPETQEYAKRVSAYLGSVNPKGEAYGAAPATAPAAPIRWEDLTEADRAAARKADRMLDPTDGMSTMERIAAGAGKAVSDAGYGVAQFLGDTLVNPASRALTGRNLVSDMRDSVAEDRRLSEALMGTAGGMGGYIGGTGLMTAIPGRLVAQAAPVVGAAAAVSKLSPALAQFVAPAAVGAATSATMPVAKEGERLDNIESGALFGALGQAAANGAGALARTAPVRAVTEPVGKAASAAVDAVRTAVPEGLGALGNFANKVAGAVYRPAWDKTATESEKSAVRAALDNGVPVYRSQLQKPGSSLPYFRGEKQRAAYDRAIARTFGEDTDDLVSAFPKARERLGEVYKSVLDNKTIPLDAQHVKDLTDVLNYAHARSPRFEANKDLVDLAQRAVNAATMNKTMTGREFQDSLRTYSSLIKELKTGSATRPSDSYAAEGVEKLTDALTRQAEKVLSKEELAAFRQANKQWRNMVTLESLAPRDAHGNINPKQLANVLARKRKGEFLYAQGDQTLPDLARYGNTFMGIESTSPRGIIASGKELAKRALPFAAADIGGAAVMGNAMSEHDASERSLLENMALYGGLGLLSHGVYSGVRNAGNPRLGAADLSRAQGALGEVLSSVSPAAVAARLGNTLRSKEAEE